MKLFTLVLTLCFGSGLFAADCFNDNPLADRGFTCRCYPGGFATMQANQDEAQNHTKLVGAIKVLRSNVKVTKKCISLLENVCSGIEIANADSKIAKCYEYIVPVRRIQCLHDIYATKNADMKRNWGEKFSNTINNSAILQKLFSDSGNGQNPYISNEDYQCMKEIADTDQSDYEANQAILHKYVKAETSEQAAAATGPAENEAIKEKQREAEAAKQAEIQKQEDEKRKIAHNAHRKCGCSGNNYPGCINCLAAWKEGCESINKLMGLGFTVKWNGSACVNDMNEPVLFNPRGR